MINITSWTELDAVRDDLTADYQLMNDLLATDIDYEGIGDDFAPLKTPPPVYPNWNSGTPYVIGDIVIDEDISWRCIQDNTNQKPTWESAYWEYYEAPGMIPFSGSFNGNGHKIHNLIISVSDSYAGLFGQISSIASITNIGLIDANVTGTTHLGVLVEENNGGTISKSYTTGIISGTGRVGGLVGQTIGGSIANCYSTVTVTNTGSASGGLVGMTLSSAVISNCYATGTVSGGSSYNAGGLIGQSSATVTNCYATGITTASTQKGGLIGLKASGTVTNCGWFRNATGATQAISGTELITYNIKDGGGTGYIDDTIDWFYDKTQDIYDTQSPVWSFGTIWYDHVDNYPDFVAPLPTTNIKSIDNLLYASIKTINNLAIALMKTFNELS